MKPDWQLLSPSGRLEIIEQGIDAGYSAGVLATHVVNVSRSALIAFAWRRGLHFGSGQGRAIVRLPYGGSQRGKPKRQPTYAQGRKKHITIAAGRKPPVRKRANSPPSVEPVAFLDRIPKRQCAWIINDDTANAMCCGGPVKEGHWQEYCAHHAEVGCVRQRRAA